MDHCYFLKFVWQFSILYDLFLSFVLIFTFIYLFVFVTLCKLFLTLPFFWVQLMYAFTAHINKSIFEKVLFGQFPLTFSKIGFTPTLVKFFFFFFFCHVPIIAQQPVNKEHTVKHYTNIFSILYKLYSLSLSLISII